MGIEIAFSCIPTILNVQQDESVLIRGEHLLLAKLRFISPSIQVR